MQDATDDWRGGVQELEVRFEDVKIDVAGAFGCRPDDIVVVGEAGEEYPKEEACCWSSVSVLLFLYACAAGSGAGARAAG